MGQSVVVGKDLQHFRRKNGALWIHASAVRLYYLKSNLGLRQQESKEFNLAGNLPTIHWPSYSPDLNILEYVGVGCGGIQTHYFVAYYDTKSVSLDTLKGIVQET